MVWIALISWIALATCIGMMVVLRRRAAEAQAAQTAWSATVRNLTIELNRLSADSQRASDWQSHLCALLNDAFSAKGAMIYSRADQDDGPPAIRLTGRAGLWPQAPAEDDVVVSLSSNIPNDFFWSRRPLVYGGHSVKSWLPQQLSQGLESVLVAPISVTKQAEFFVLLYRGEGEPAFGQQEQQLMAECIGQIELAMRVVVAVRDRKTAEFALNRAHEEGMLQISTGIIHNIGNAITVIQMALDRLHGDDLEAIAELAGLIDTDMLPAIEEHNRQGTLEAFLRDDPQGKEYLPALHDMVLQIRKVISIQQEDVDFITEKFRNVTEIISLQQQFIGELGTENVVTVKAMLNDVVKMCQAPLDQRDIKLNTDFMAPGRVLLDPAMMRHILLILLKYSIESVTASRKVNPSITLTALEAKEDDRSWVRIMIADNGAGVSVDLETLDKRLEEHPSDERARDLHFCRQRIAKYGGRLTMASDMARGLRTVIEIPEYVPGEADTDPESRIATKLPTGPTITEIASETQDITFDETRIIDRSTL